MNNNEIENVNKFLGESVGQKNLRILYSKMDINIDIKDIAKNARAIYNKHSDLMDMLSK